MTPKELNELAHSIAFEESASLLDCHSLSVTEGEVEWWDIGECADDHHIKQALKYLDARGLIERHLRRSNLICVMEESEATHPVNLSQPEGGQ